jgi:hypothetical protein
LKFTFAAALPPALDLLNYQISSPELYGEAGEYLVEGIVFNQGTNAILSFDLAYQLGANAIETETLEDLNITNFEAYEYTHSIPVSIASGNQILRVWISNVNGSTDSDTSNDTLSLGIKIGKEIPNLIPEYLAATPRVSVIGDASDKLVGPTDLDFHPDLEKNQMWVINKRTESIGGSTVIYDNPGETNQADISLVDQNAWHFMSLPTGIAFGKNGNFANSPGVFDANHNGGAAFTGPALWSGDLGVYAQPSGGNGSHLDMLHVSPYSQGIAHEKQNVYWVFDGYNNDIVRYDFVNDHGPGNSFHEDAIIHRYKDFAVSRDPNHKVVSHLVVSNGFVYSVDYGNKRVFRIEIGTGSIGNTPAYGPFENIVEYKYIVDYNWEEVVTTGLVEPAGIEIIENHMLVTDYATGEIIVYDITNMPATELGRIPTGATGIMGVKIGPKGNIWFVDFDKNTVNRVDRSSVGVSEMDLALKMNLYPNPANDRLGIKVLDTGIIKVEVSNALGVVIYSDSFEGNKKTINTSNWASGLYFVKVINGSKMSVKNVLIQH